MDLPADPAQRVRQSLHRFATDALASRAEPKNLAADVEGLCGQYSQLDSTIRDFYSAAQVFLLAMNCQRRAVRATNRANRKRKLDEIEQDEQEEVEE